MKLSTPSTVLAGELISAPGLPQSKDKTTALGYAFFGFSSMSAGGAGFQNFAQIKNPVGSGKVIFVDRAWVRQEAGGPSVASCILFDTDLTTPITAFNKNANASAPVGRFAQQASNSITPIANIDVRDLPNATGYAEFVFDPPIRLGEGRGFCTVNGPANQTSKQGISWREY